MTVNALQTADVTGGTFTLLLLGLLAETALLLLATGWVAARWRLPIALAALVGLVAALDVFEARDVWLALKQAPVAYHYAAAMITIPLQVIALYFFVTAVSPPPVALFWRLLVVSIAMELVRYLGDAGFTHAALSFLVGIVLWLYILGEAYFGRMNEIVGRSEDETVQRGYFWLRLIVTIGWAVDPLGSFVSGFGGGVDPGSLAIAYNLADFVNRIAFGLAILATALAAPAGAPSPAGKPAHEQR